jgi:hypothetical protein
LSLQQIRPFRLGNFYKTLFNQPTSPRALL